MVQAQPDMNGDLRQMLTSLSDKERQRLEKHLWTELQDLGISPQHEVHQAGMIMPRICLLMRMNSQFPNTSSIKVFPGEN